MLQKKLANIDKILYDDRFRIPPMAFFIERSKQKEKFINWLKNLAQENELNHHFATAMSSSAATEAYAAYRLYAQRDEILSFVATNYAVLDAVGKVTLDDLREAFNDIRNKKTKNTSLAIQRCQPLIDELMKPTTLSIGSSGQQAPKTISHDEIRQSSSATINSSVIADVVMPVLTWVEKKEQEIETATAALVAIIKKAAVALQEIYRKYPNFKPEQFEALSQNSEQGSVAIQEEFITTTIAMGSDYAEAKRLFLLINITKTKATKTETTVDTDPDYAEAKRLLNDTRP